MNWKLGWVVASLVALAASGVSAADKHVIDLGELFSVREPVSRGASLEVVGHLAPHQNSAPISLESPSNWSGEFTVYLRANHLEAQPNAFRRSYRSGVVEIWRHEPANAPWRPGMSTERIPAFDPALVPARFRDGELVLAGDIEAIDIVDFASETSRSIIHGTGISLDRGSWADQLAQAALTDGWIWNGYFERQSVPSGYGYRYGGTLELESPTPVVGQTWGAIKALWNAP